MTKTEKYYLKPKQTINDISFYGEEVILWDDNSEDIIPCVFIVDREVLEDIELIDRDRYVGTFEGFEVWEGRHPINRIAGCHYATACS